MGADEARGSGPAEHRSAGGWLTHHERPTMAALVVAGVALRAGWCAMRSGWGAPGEAMRVAQAVGAGRGFADAYRIGQGPTAHLLPVSPGIAGSVYAVFGVGSKAAEVVLFCWSAGLAMATMLVLYRAFARLGVSVPARLAGVAFGCLAPTYIAQEAVDFRVWDGGLAALLGACVLARAIRAEHVGSMAIGEASGLAALTAVLFFVNPSVGVAYGLCAAWVVARRLDWRDWWRPVALGAIVLALLVVPWATRNDRVMGQPILLRSNAGLELAIGLYPGEREAADRGDAFQARLADIHPSSGDGPYRAMQAAGGEIAYARMLGRGTSAWAQAHPGDIAALLALHIRQTVIPAPWQFGTFGSERGTLLRAALAQLVGVLGIAGLAVGLARRGAGWWCPASVILLLLLLGAPFQPVKRYTYLVYPTLVFAAASLIDLRHRPMRRNKAAG